jgi:hypothetical protein
MKDIFFQMILVHNETAQLICAVLYSLFIFIQVHNLRFLLTHSQLKKYIVPSYSKEIIRILLYTDKKYSIPLNAYLFPSHVEQTTVLTPLIHVVHIP